MSPTSSSIIWPWFTNCLVFTFFNSKSIFSLVNSHLIIYLRILTAFTKLGFSFGDSAPPQTWEKGSEREHPAGRDEGRKGRSQRRNHFLWWSWWKISLGPAAHSMEALWGKSLAASSSTNVSFSSLSPFLLLQVVFAPSSGTWSHLGSRCPPCFAGSALVSPGVKSSPHRAIPSPMLASHPSNSFLVSTQRQTWTRFCTNTSFSPKISEVPQFWFLNICGSSVLWHRPLLEEYDTQETIESLIQV